MPLSAHALVHRIAQASVTSSVVYAINPNRGTTAFMSYDGQ